MKAKPELLSPVFDLVSLRAAISAGADAVYFGLKGLNMRITAKNFELGQLKNIVKICHENNVKAYLTLNTIIYDEDMKKLEAMIKEAKKAKVDAVICWDPAVIMQARKITKGKIPLHISTQASVSNSEAARFYKKLGAKRIILARELNLKQIKDIKNKVNIEIECFVHGAMCVSMSGRCFMSQFVFGRSANRGDCLQPCRRSYIIKDKEEGFELELGNNYVLSPMDLCTLPFIEKLIEAGIDAFKIEGRARSPEYVKVVTECYRKAIDAYFDKKLTPELKQELMNKLRTVYNRGFGKGFYLGKPINEWAEPESKATERKKFIGIVRNYYKKPSVAEIKIEAGNLKIGDKIMIQGPTTGIIEQIIDSMEINHKKVNSALKGQDVGVKISNIARKNDKVFVLEKIGEN